MLSKENGSLTLVAVGDIQLLRRDWKMSFERVAHIIKGADISFFNCEGPYAEQGPFSSFWYPDGKPADPKNMAAFTTAGFNIANMANNVSLNWGLDAAIECRQLLEARGIAVCGFGRNIDEARQPAIMEKNGVKVAFLGYLAVGPYEYEAEDDRPGMAVVKGHTLYEPYEYNRGPTFHPGTQARILTWPDREDLCNMIEDIKKARKQADVVIIVYHWGIHHTRAIIPDYQWEIGHAAIDAGADLILGTHPHILKGIEVYKGKVIIHSLSNFAVEDAIARREGVLPHKPVRRWRWEEKKLGSGTLTGTSGAEPDDQKSIIVKCIIAGHKIERVSYIPVILKDNASPEPLPRSDPRSQDVVKYMEDIAREVGLNTQFYWEGDEVRIGV
jgi:poly-gamma-glutamate synthesis protein (capsule biosynthesis protein)